MSDLINERDERTERRKKEKKMYDSMYNLSAENEKVALSYDSKIALSDNSIRLLDEGAVVGDGYIRLFIKKGTLEKFLNGENEYLDNLADEFVGTVNLGHLDFATFPYVIGEWRKNDLTLVDIGDDRKGIDVELHLDDDSVFVKELARQPYDIGVSAEFYCHYDYENSEILGFPVVDEVYITAYALVGECGNVNSSGLELKGEIMDIKEVTENVATENLDIEEVTEETVEVAGVEETAETTLDVEEVKTEADDEGSEELASEEVNDDEAGEDETTLSEISERVNELIKSNEELKARVDELTQNNEELKKTNKRLSAKIQKEKAEKQEFVSKFPTFSKKVGESNEVSVADYVYGDGIGE